jgi:hemolysin activation/secretion protein
MLMYRTFWDLSTKKNTIKSDRWYQRLAFLMILATTTQTQSLQAQPIKQDNITEGQQDTIRLNSHHPPDPSVVLKVSSPEKTKTNPHLMSAGTVPQHVTVESFEVRGSTVFSQEELSAVLVEYQNRPLSLSELYQARSAITKLYTDKGYVNSGAYIPPQELVGKTVTISVLEGRLEGINVTGTKHLNRNYIRSRIAQGAGTPVNVESLLQALQMLRIDPLVKNVSAELSAGITPGTSLLEVEIEEADPFKITTKFDNKRSPSVGTNRRGVGLIHSDLLGFGDKITFDYTNTEGSDSLDTSYTLPFNALNGTFRVAYGTSSNEIIEKPFTPLDIESESKYYELGIRQPLVATPKEEFALGLSFSFQDSKTKLLDTPFPLSNGADENGETKIGALRFVQEYVNRDDTKVLALRSQFSVGLDVFGATQNQDDIPDSSFFAWRGQSQWVQSLDEDFLFLLRGDIQFSSTELVPLEQFRIGGVDSVRGYRQDLSLGDNGLFTSAEMRIPIFRLKKIDGVMQLTPFIDLGTIWNSNDKEISQDFLASLGIGLNFRVGNAFNARFDWGIPLINVDSQGNSLQEDGVYFSFGWNFL